MDGSAFTMEMRERFEAVLGRDLGVPRFQRTFYSHWVYSFLEFCRVRTLHPGDAQGSDAFLNGMIGRGRPGFQIEQARIAIGVYRELFRAERPAAVDAPALATAVGSGLPDEGFSGDWRMALEALGREIRLKHYSVKTFKSYHHWVRAFSRYVGDLPVAGVTSEKAAAFISHLAVERKVSASTQNQAFSAMLFFFNRVLRRELEGLEKTPRAVKRQDVPVVLTRREVQIVLSGLEYPYKLFAQLLYGCGLRLNEGLMLRVQDLDLDGGSVHVHNGKGDKSRTLPLPKALHPALVKHLESVRGVYDSDLQVGFAGVMLPDALERKIPKAPRSWPWQWVFPGGRLTVSESDGKLRRFHLHESGVQKEIKAAAELGQLTKRVTAHTLRHSYATHLLQMGYDIRTVQDLMGHNDVSTTMIYTHALQAISGKVMSPLDI